jgi:AcrR family transcriptional regulator
VNSHDVNESTRRRTFYERFLKKVPQQSRSRTLVDSVLGAVIERLRGKAEDNVTIQEIAARAGVAMGSLYDYFPDRESLLNAALTKLSADNLEAFEAALARTADRPLRDAVTVCADFLLETYARDQKSLRMLLSVTARLGLLPALATSQTAAAHALADALRRREDVKVADVDTAAWLLTQSMMGVAMMLVWQDDPPAREDVRRAVITMAVAYLRGGPQSENAGARMS